jgi:hypothetical protein
MKTQKFKTEIYLCLGQYSDEKIMNPESYVDNRFAYILPYIKIAMPHSSVGEILPGNKYICHSKRHLIQFGWLRRHAFISIHKWDSNIWRRETRNDPPYKSWRIF